MSETKSPNIHPSASEKVASFHAETVEKVANAIQSNPIVVVGMGWNPHVKRARKALEAAGHAVEYIEIGNYSSEWSPRLAIKMWSGWPTFPQVFVNGGLLGGANETEKALEDGSLAKLLAE